MHGVYLAGKKHPAVFHHCPTIVTFLLVKSSFSQNHPFVSQNHPVISQNHPRLCILQNSPVRILIEELTVGPRLPGSQLSTRSPASIDVKVTLLRPGDVMARERFFRRPPPFEQRIFHHEKRTQKSSYIYIYNDYITLYNPYFIPHVDLPEKSLTGGKIHI